MHSQLSSAQLWLSSASQHRAVPCGALPCGVVPCRAAVYFLACIQYQVSCEVPSTTYRGMYGCTSIFSFLLEVVLSRSSFLIFFHPANSTRSADQNRTSPASTQRRTRQSASHQAAIGMITSLVAPNHGALLLFSAPFNLFVVFLLARV